MKIVFRQTYKAGCLSYALANLFRDSRFLDGVEKITTGEDVWNANNKLSKYEPSYYLESLFITQSTFTKQDNRLKDTIIFSFIKEKFNDVEIDTLTCPFLVTFQRPTKSFHCILVMYNLKDDLLYIFDSLNKERIVMEVEDFLETYFITTVECFLQVPEKQYESSPDRIFFYKSLLPHLFNPNE